MAFTVQEKMAGHVEPPEQLATVKIIIIIVVKLSRFFIMEEIWIFSTVKVKSNFRAELLPETWHFTQAPALLL